MAFVHSLLQSIPNLKKTFASDHPGINIRANGTSQKLTPTEKRGTALLRNVQDASGLGGLPGLWGGYGGAETCNRAGQAPSVDWTR